MLVLGPLTAALRPLAPPADPMPAVLAAVLVAVHRVVLSVLRDRVLDEVEAGPDVGRTSARAFAALAPETSA